MTAPSFAIAVQTSRVKRRRKNEKKGTDVPEDIDAFLSS
jgi:hypothetical protein